MNKKLIPVIVILLILAGGAYYMKSKPTSLVSNQSASQNMAETNEFARAMESGEPMTCTMTKDQDVLEYRVKGKLMRANMTNVLEGKTTITHMINDGAYLYMWSPDTKQGSKTAIPTEEESQAMADKAKQYQADTAPELKSQADYDNLKNSGYAVNCKTGGVNDADFVPPTDVKFVDPTAMMKQVQGGSGQIDYKKLQEQYAGMQQPGVEY
jgi:hypothetical protein